MSKMIDSDTIKSDALLLLTAIIWGFAFVAQRAGMEHMGPFLFNGLRFALGSISLFPVYLLTRKTTAPFISQSLIFNGVLAGSALFLGASLQQVGIVYTTAGNAGFITGLYVIIVPMIGIFLKQKLGKLIWISSILAVSGLYLISGNSGISISRGDFLVLLSAVFWAVHVQLINNFTRKQDSIKLAMIQFAVCSLLSLTISFIWEDIQLSSIIPTGIPVLYGGLMSVGIAYTLQVVAQKKTHPAHAAIILSLESVFALIGGILILNEGVSGKKIAGCALMLSAMILSQIKSK